jgi:DNA transformation protein
VALDRGLVAHVLEMLEPLGGITGRAMFGGYGVWHDGQMFALFDSDTTFYLKAGDTNRTAFKAAGSTPFRPPVPAGRAPMTMPYYEAPSHLLDDAEALREWARAAIEVAHATPPKPPRASRAHKR